MKRAPQVLIADRSQLMQQWLAAAVRGAFGTVDATCVSSGTELLHHIADCGPYDLVVSHAMLPEISGGQVLAMVRTANLNTPFIVLSYVPSAALTRMVNRVGHADLVDDPLDAAAVRAAARQLVASNGSCACQACA